MRHTIALSGLIALLMLLSGCGQTGPLYHPEPAPVTEGQPAAAASSAEQSD